MSDLTVEKMTAILVDASTGKQCEYDTVEEAAFRAKMDREVAEIRAEGMTVYIPSELPGPRRAAIRRGS